MDKVSGIIPEDIFQKIAEVDTPTVSNAIETFHIRNNNEGFATQEIRCMCPELGSMLGYAITVQVDGSMEDPGPSDGFRKLCELAEKSPKPSIIVFQDIGLNKQAKWGDIATTLFGRLGTTGFVSDGPVRDIEQIRKLKFHCFATGFVSSHGYNRIIRIGVPVRVGGLLIHQGDLLHGDINGLHLIPKQIVKKLPEEIENTRRFEKEIMEYIMSPDFSLNETLNKMGYENEDMHMK